MTNGPRFEAITAVTIVDLRLPSSDVFHSLESTLSGAAVDYEIVIIANGVAAEIAQQLRLIAETVANVTVHFLAQRVDRDTAILVGIDQALGDWVVVLTPTVEEVACLPKILEKAGSYEIIFAGARERKEFPIAYWGVAHVYFKLYEMVSGSALEWPSPRIRIYSRAAARHLASQLDGEFALRSLHFSGAFPGTREILSGLPSTDLELPSPGYALRKAFRGLLNASAVPLRIVIVTALVTGVVAVLSSVYTVIVYLFKEDVTPGWTTISLQISTMMLLFSIMFALLTGYVLNVYRATAPRRRISVVREIRSPLRRQADRLNVIGAHGTFDLGAPPQQPSELPRSEHAR